MVRVLILIADNEETRIFHVQCIFIILVQLFSFSFVWVASLLIVEVDLERTNHRSGQGLVHVLIKMEL